MAKRSKNPASNSENRRLAKSQMRKTAAKKKSSSTAPLKLKKPAVKTVEDKRTKYDKMSFSKAFAAGRKAAKAGGDKTFYWRGKRYGTKLKSEVKAKVPKKKVDVTPKSSTPEIRRRRAPGKDTGPVIVPKKKDTKVNSSKTTFANKSTKYAGQTGKSSTKPVVKSKRTDKPATSNIGFNKGKFRSAVQPTTGTPGIYKKPKATTRKKPYHAKAKPAQPVAKPRAAVKPKAKPSAKKKSSGSAIGRFERKLVRGMNRGIRKAKRAVKRALK
jgi:hypothetical protein